jgi:hypothetical protein
VLLEKASVWTFKLAMYCSSKVSLTRPRLATKVVARLRRLLRRARLDPHAVAVSGRGLTDP